MGISCDDAVGWPGFKEDVHRDYPITECNGNFLRHHTLEKSKTKESSSESVMQALSQILQVAVQRNMREVWIQEPERKESEKKPEKEPEEEVKEVEELEHVEDAKDDASDETLILTGLRTADEPSPQEVRSDDFIIPILD